tara:strand:+ start:528 stop:1475 length:948 start_codon:yes stop_codon:yes gene_type:complete
MNYSIGGNLNLAKKNEENTFTKENIFTENITAPQLMSEGSHLKLGSSTTNDCNFYLNNQETLQLTRNGTECRATVSGGTGDFRFMGKVFGNSDLDIAGNEVKLSALPTSAQSTGVLWNNSGAINIGSGASGGGGVCLETINSYCNGDSFTTAYGDSMTIPAVTAVQDITSQLPTYTDITGSSISYRPPSSATLVIFTFQTQISGRASGAFDNQDCQFKMFYGGTEIPLGRMVVCNNNNAFGYIDFSVPIQIDSSLGSDDIANGKVKSWSSLVTLKWSACIITVGVTFPINTKFGFSEGGSLDTFSKPKVKIEAFS